MFKVLENENGNISVSIKSLTQQSIDYNCLFFIHIYFVCYTRVEKIDTEIDGLCQEHSKPRLELLASIYVRVTIRKTTRNAAANKQQSALQLEIETEANRCSSVAVCHSNSNSSTTTME